MRIRTTCDTGTLDLTAIEGRLRSRFPDAEVVAPVRAVGQGFYSIAVETANGLIFRVGRNQQSAIDYGKEAKLLPCLAEVLPVAVPRPLWIDGGSPEFRHGAMGYRRLDGQSLSPERLAACDQELVAGQVAEFLRTLHGFPVTKASALGAGVAVTHEVMGELRARTMPSLQCEFNVAEFDALENWWDVTIADDLLDDFTPVVSHGDLWYDHLLVDERGRLTGVVDWQGIHVGDPAHGDFAPMMYLGHPFVAAVLRAYFSPAEVPASFADRVTTYWQLREYWGVDYSLAHDDRDEFRESIRKLRAGGILNPRVRSLTQMVQDA